MSRNKKPSGCSPVRYSNKSRTLDATGTCLTPEEVVEVAKAVEVLPSEENTEKQKKNHASKGRFDAKTLVRRVNEALGVRPGQEDDWLEAPQVAKRKDLTKKISSAFRPEHPKEWLDDPHYWLSNFDIDAVMKQYMELSDRFRFIGVFPRDFSAPMTEEGSSSAPNCVSKALCTLSLAEEISKGFRELGFVLNLDTHRGPGTHWTSCYIGLDPSNRPHRFGFFYYDSVGRLPPKEIREFGEKLAAEASAIFPNAKVPFRVAHNTVRKQFQGSECGIYSMFFLVACTQTETPFETICRDVMKKDRNMHALRKVFFREP